jgi:hypothetical protein
VSKGGSVEVCTRPEIKFLRVKYIRIVCPERP